jgi:hypothetical protein
VNGLIVLTAGLTLAPSATGPSPAEAVARLGSSSYRDREAAARVLVEWGPSALPALQAGSRWSDPEIVARCRRLLPLARRSEGERLADAFLAARGAGPTLPGWERFRNRFGPGEAERDLFAAMYRANPTLLELMDAAEQEAARGPATPQPPARQQLRDRLWSGCSPLAGTGQVMSLGRGQRYADSGRAPRPGELEALLFAAASPAHESPLSGLTLIQVLRSERFDRARLGEPVVRGLVSDFLARQTADPGVLRRAIEAARDFGLRDCLERSLVPAARRAVQEAGVQPVNTICLLQVLDLAEALDLPEGLALGLRAARRPDLSANARARAVVLVARHGTAANAAALGPVLEDDGDLGELVVNGLGLQGRVGDVALAAVNHLAGRPPDEAGIPYFALVPGETLFSVSPVCCGFPDDATRAAAVRRWRERCAGGL